MYGDALVYGAARVYSSAQVYGDAWVSGDARVSDDAQVSGDARVSGNARVYGDARVCKRGDYWSLVGLEHHVTYTRSDDSLAIGCERRTVQDWLSLDAAEHESAPQLESILRAMFAAYETLSKGK